ncbi:hypothetical protein [His2 virus]|uniref:Uncharacterized protein n=1 Tax=His 2 virus TaxID=128710 RepID=Q25BD9_HIS2V|nr:hypothetical protein His2V_gp21 [His2 virus]AAQ13788.1 hypothetical protein [His2 virus]
MYDQLECGKCGFSPNKQSKSEPFESEHWQTSREMEYRPSIDEFVSWDEVRCPICNTLVYRND